MHGNLFDWGNGGCLFFLFAYFIGSVMVRGGASLHMRGFKKLELLE